MLRKRNPYPPLIGVIRCFVFSSPLAVPPKVDEQLKTIFKERNASVRLFFGELQRIHATFLDILNIKEMIVKLGSDDGSPLPAATVGYLE